jgi:hypothetical protein
MPEPVRLTDLVHPQVSAEVRATMDAGAELAAGLTYDLDRLAEQASAETGLEDFGDDLFRAPLTILGEALETEGGMTPFGRLVTCNQLLQSLKNRLLIADLLKRHPEIHDLEVRAPIMIAGLPRTGTTHLHNLLAADPRLRSLPYWESLEPVLAPSEEPNPGEPDPRPARTDAAVDFISLMLPYFERMHEMTTDHVHEEIQLLATSGSTMLFDTIAPMPSWRRWYRAADQTPHYEDLKTILKVLQFTRGGDRWVLKSPQHLEQFEAIRRVFPDATVVVTHRDPVAVTLSMTTMIAYTSRLTHDPVPVEAIGRYWTELLAEMLTTCAETREALGENAVDVHCDRFMADDLGVVRNLYALADQPFDDDTERAIRAYVDTHPRGRHGQIIYDFDDVMLDPAELRERFAPYVERFGVTVER